MIRLGLLLALVATPVAAADNRGVGTTVSDELTVSQLYNGCRLAAMWSLPQGDVIQAAIESNRCYATVAAIAKIAYVLKGEPEICFPEGITYPQLIRIVLTHVDKYPERQHFSLAVLTIQAFRDNFPCAKAR